MLSRHAKRVLNILKSLSENTDAPIGYVYGEPSFILLDNEKTASFKEYDNEIDSIMSLLENEAMIEVIKNHVFHLTQQGIHYREYQLKNFALYLADKWVSILALVISIVSLIISLIR